jgi:predicted AlkP superfamily pyrophosphatase or phosphodiesterase
MPMLPGFETQHSGDAYAAGVFNHILRTHRPNLALLHLIDVDHTQHEKGPRTPEAYEAIKVADQQVREVWDELQRDFPGKATLVIVSDHGFSPVTRTILPNVILRKAGLQAEDNAGTKDAVSVVIQGGSVLIYVRDETRHAEIVERARQAFTGVPGVASVIGTKQFKEYGVADPKDDPHAPDLIAFAEEGGAFGKTTAGDALFKDKTEVSGTHGHDSRLPHLHATFVAWGVGVKQGGKLDVISNIDVAPTVAQLLGIALPTAEGKPLAKILTE